MILNKAGDIVTKSGKDVVGNPKLLNQMLDAATKYVQSIPNDDDGEQEDVSFIRIRARHEEILVSPKNGYVLVVLQDPNISPL